MATKKCNACGKLMGFEHTHCVSCGAEYKVVTPKWIVVVCLLVALGVGIMMGMPKSNTTPPEKSERVKAIEQQASSSIALKKFLKDPDSAEVRNHKGNCGEVNSKNSFGGYTGFKRFIASPAVVVIEGENMPSDEFQKTWEQVCR